jgi:hypothetical protein
MHEVGLNSTFGLYITNKSTYNITSVQGKAFVQKYNITAVPTVLLSPGAADYVNLASDWTQMGTVEKDGWFVFRTVGKITGSNYTNLTTGKVVTAQ